MLCDWLVAAVLSLLLYVVSLCERKTTYRYNWRSLGRRRQER